MNAERRTRNAESGGDVASRSALLPFRVPRSAFRVRVGFTLLELMLAVAILAMVTTVTYLTFSTVAEAWRRGMKLTDSLHHGDFVIEQIVMGLRSAYYPETRAGSDQYGFWHDDDGEGEFGSDEIGWVKLGATLVGKDCTYAGSPHRVKLTVEDDDDGRRVVSVTSWRAKGQPEDFDPEDPEHVDQVFLSSRITGFNCRAAFERIDDEIDWLDEWEETNKLPRMVEISLYLEPLDDGEPPVEIKRVLGIHAAELCWSGGK